MCLARLWHRWTKHCREVSWSLVVCWAGRREWEHLQSSVCSPLPGSESFESMHELQRGCRAVLLDCISLRRNRAHGRSLCVEKEGASLYLCLVLGLLGWHVNSQPWAMPVYSSFTASPPVHIACARVLSPKTFWISLNLLFIWNSVLSLVWRIT